MDVFLVTMPLDVPVKGSLLEIQLDVLETNRARKISATEKRLDYLRPMYSDL
jgi:hypothetical protein